MRDERNEVASATAISSRLIVAPRINYLPSPKNRGEVDGASLAADHAPRKGVNAAWTTNTFLPRFSHYETPVIASGKGG